MTPGRYSLSRGELSHPEIPIDFDLLGIFLAPPLVLLLSAHFLILLDSNLLHPVTSSRRPHGAFRLIPAHIIPLPRRDSETPQVLQLRARIYDTHHASPLLLLLHLSSTNRRVLYTDETPFTGGIPAAKMLKRATTKPHIGPVSPQTHLAPSLRTKLSHVSHDVGVSRRDVASPNHGAPVPTPHCVHRKGPYPSTPGLTSLSADMMA